MIDEPYNLEASKRAIEITEGTNLDTLTEVYFAIKTGRKVVVIHKDNRVSCWIDDDEP